MYDVKPVSYTHLVDFNGDDRKISLSMKVLEAPLEERTEEEAVSMDVDSYIAEQADDEALEAASVENTEEYTEEA